MKTLILFLLPLQLIAQCADIPVSDGWVFSQIFPSPCNYQEDWQEIDLPCHGAINQAGVIRYIVLTEPTTITLTANSLSDDVVATVWDNCPYTGGQVIASVECGGYDCIVDDGLQTTYTLTLVSGEYWFWIGLYSDGENCSSGFVSGSYSTGGSCPPCPTFTMTGSYEEFTYCGGETEPWDTQTPCGIYTHYATVQFDAQQPYTTINVSSQMNYINAPFTPWNFAHIQVIDACQGTQVWNTSGGACAVGSDLALTGEHPAQNYSVDLALPEGTYILVFGYAMQPNQFGCVTVGIGNPTFLDLKPEDYGAGRDHWGQRKPRYTKVVIEGKGVFIRDNKTGKFYDFLNRTVVIK